MPRGYRCILVALVGVVLTGASPPNHPDQNSAAGSNQSETAAAAYKPDPNRNSEGCYENGNHDAADLCAQWSAADAAKETAGLSYWGNWIAGFGALLSFASVILVLIALKQGRKANRIAEDTAKRQLRAYVMLKGADLDQIDRDGMSHATIIVANTGATPAHDVVFWGTTSVREWPSEGIADAARPDWLKVAVEAIAKDREATLVLPIGPIPDDWIGRLKVGSAGIFFYGEVAYRDAFDESHTTTIHLVCEGESLHRSRFHACETGNSAN